MEHLDPIPELTPEEQIIHDLLEPIINHALYALQIYSITHDTLESVGKTILDKIIKLLNNGNRPTNTAL